MISVLHAVTNTHGVFLGSNKHSDGRDYHRAQVALAYLKGYRLRTIAYSRAAWCSSFLDALWLLHISSYNHPELSS